MQEDESAVAEGQAPERTDETPAAPPEPIRTVLGQLGPDERGRQTQLFEVGAFIFLILPSMLLSFVAVGSGGLSFVLGGFAVICRDLALVLLVLYFVWRNRESVLRIGWNVRHFWLDVLIGVLLFLPMFFASGLVDEAARQMGLSPGPKSLPAELSPQGTGELVLAGIMVVVVALAEETIFRGYLILRLRAVTRSPAAAVLLSTFIFSLGHGYEGSAGVVTVGFMGLVFALVYLWRGSLVAPIVMHFIQDFLGIVLRPLISGT